MSLLLFLAAPALAAPLANLGDLTITEIQSDTSSISEYYGEWFEIYNNSHATQDLQGILLSVSQDSGSSWDTFTVTGSLVVGVDDYVVFGVSDNTNVHDPDYNGNVPIDYEYKFFDVNDPNTHFDIKLSQSWMQVATSSGSLLDEVSWDPSWGALSDNALQVSLNAYKVEWANDFPDNW